MKKTIAISAILCLLISFNFLFAQNTKNSKPPLTLYTTESGSFILDTVINVKDVLKQELYNRAKNWVISTVRTSDKTVVFDDTEFNEIRTDVTLALPKFTGVSVNFKISIYLKDNKCRFVSESFIYNYIGQGGVVVVALEKRKGMGTGSIYKEFDKEFTIFINSFFTSLSKKSKTDW